MPFNRSEVDELLTACHRFCGVKIETDHIIPAGDGGGFESFSYFLPRVARFALTLGYCIERLQRSKA